jgi:hypothetical protein
VTISDAFETSLDSILVVWGSMWRRQSDRVTARLAANEHAWTLHEARSE